MQMEIHEENIRRTPVDGMTDEAFTHFSEFIEEELGIKMPIAKKTMLQARLQKRLWKLGIDSFEDYYDYVFSVEGRELELQQMIDVVTTNKTDFFRESNHFDYLTEHVLPDMLKRYGSERQYMFWCAGCSSGEEPYSLAMTLHHFAEERPNFHFLILATDISSRVLDKAKLGIYEEEAAEPVPDELRRKYLLKSKEKDKGLVRIAPEIRAYVKFRQVNLVKGEFGFRESMDVIFCRNVIIYFNRETQEQVINRLYQHLNPGGFLFTGHSETLNGLAVPLKAVAHTVYQKDASAANLPQNLPIITLKPAELYVSDQPAIIRTVLGSCVAVTMFDKRLGVAAMCHALLPQSNEAVDNNAAFQGNPLYKYVNSVIPLMLSRLQEFGSEIKDLEVKLFGGADMLTIRTGNPNFQPVGRSNIDAVLQAIKSNHLELAVSDVGGHTGRKILFYTQTGEVLLKRIKSGMESGWGA